jgi:hypothetical protein
MTTSLCVKLVILMSLCKNISIYAAAKWDKMYFLSDKPFQSSRMFMSIEGEELLAVIYQTKYFRNVMFEWR